MKLHLPLNLRLFLSLAAILAVVLSSNSLRAQKTSVTDIPSDGSQTTTTTIQVKKGDQPSADRDFEILDGSAEVAGEPNLMSKGARESWKKACDEWKKEVKDLNKENQVVVLNCNSPHCAIESGSTVCKSTASYKLRVKIKK